MEGVVGGGEPGDRTKCIGEGAYRGGEERGLNNLHGYFFLSLKRDTIQIMKAAIAINAKGKLMCTKIACAFMHMPICQACFG